MRKTGKKIGLYRKDTGWNFVRTIYADENSKKYIKINGYHFDLDYVIAKADSFYIDRADRF